MKRTVVEIDAKKCDGCGVCLLCCEEGALEINDNKAVLAREFACDGLGSCIGECPQNAINTIEKECVPCDIKSVMEAIVPRGEKHIDAYIKHLEKHALFDLRDEAIAYLRANNINFFKPNTCL